LPPSRIGSKQGGKKAEACLAAAHLSEALADFSGYIAADELYDGPFCVLSIVDNRQFQPLVYEVLEHDPTHQDIQRFFARLKAILDARGLTVRGITTDASPLYPVPITAVFGPVPHQVCEFHTVRELTEAVLQAVARVRRTLTAQLPKLPRGRPTSRVAKRQARRKQRRQQHVTDLFDHRYLFVQRSLRAAERKTLARISRGHKPLRVLREIIDEVYRLFDRRCRSETALHELAKLRRRVQRFKPVGKTLHKLFSPNLEKALTFLDDKLLPSTSSAVERGNRRHRKMQKTIYRVRTRQTLSGRIALDMLRDAQAPGRTHTTQTLHLARAGSQFTL
jgi:transposase